jgi:DNA-directed RNA polymerase II subunit RPB11
MNAPDRLDTVRLPEGSQKMYMTIDEKMPNAATFKVLREDHTVGNLVRM